MARNAAIVATPCEGQETSPNGGHTLNHTARLSGASSTDTASTVRWSLRYAGSPAAAGDPALSFTLIGRRETPRPCRVPGFAWPLSSLCRRQ